MLKSALTFNKGWRFKFQRHYISMFNVLPAFGCLGVKAHDYVMRIVPTIVHHSNGMALHPYQYTFGYRVSSALRQAFVVPVLATRLH